MRKFLFVSALMGLMLMSASTSFAHEYRHRGHGSHDRGTVAIKYGALILRDIIHSGCDHHHHGSRYERHYKKHRGHVCRISYHDHGRGGHYKKYSYRR